MEERDSTVGQGYHCAEITVTPSPFGAKEIIMGKLIQDVGYGARMLLAKPGFAAITILTLALGIGANTAIFTVVEAALLRGLPYDQPERLFHLFETTPQKEYPQREFSYPDYQDYLTNQVFEGITAYTGGGGALLTGRGEPERLFAPSVTANFFTLLGVTPIVGRTFNEGDDKPGAPRVVVLSYGLWQRMFARDTRRCWSDTDHQWYAANNRWRTASKFHVRAATRRSVDGVPAK